MLLKQSSSVIIRMENLWSKWEFVHRLTALLQTERKISVEPKGIVFYIKNKGIHKTFLLFYPSKGGCWINPSEILDLFAIHTITEFGFKQKWLFLTSKIKKYFQTFIVLKKTTSLPQRKRLLIHRDRNIQLFSGWTHCTYIQETVGTIAALLVGPAHGLIVIKGNSTGKHGKEFH